MGWCTGCRTLARVVSSRTTAADCFAPSTRDSRSTQAEHHLPRRRAAGSSRDRNSHGTSPFLPRAAAHIRGQRDIEHLFFGYLPRAAMTRKTSGSHRKASVQNHALREQHGRVRKSHLRPGEGTLGCAPRSAEVHAEMVRWNGAQHRALQIPCGSWLLLFAILRLLRLCV